MLKKKKKSINDKKQQTKTNIQCITFHDWYNKSHGMCSPVCGMVHIKEPLLLIEKSSPCGSSGFSVLSEWCFTICLMPYNRKMC